jgi:hypothetical protein
VRSSRGGRGNADEARALVGRLRDYLSRFGMALSPVRIDLREILVTGLNSFSDRVEVVRGFLNGYRYRHD